METKIYALCQRWIVYVLLLAFFLQNCNNSANPFLSQEEDPAPLDKSKEDTNQPKPVLLPILPNNQVYTGSSDLQEGMEKEYKHVNSADPGIEKKSEKEELTKKEEQATKGQKKISLITNFFTYVSEAWFKNSPQEKATKKQEKTEFINNLITSFQEAWFEDPLQAYQSDTYLEMSNLASTDNRIARILLIYPHNVTTPESKVGRYHALIKFYENGTAEPHLSKEQNEAKIKILKQKIQDLYEENVEECEETGNYGNKGNKLFMAKEYKMAEKILLQAKASPYALGLLGKIYEEGYNSKPNYQKAATYYEQAATTNSFCDLGSLYMDGYIGSMKGVPDYQQAVKYFELSGEKAALHNLALLYYRGHVGNVGDQPNYEKAKEYFEKSGSSDALHYVAMIYYEGQLDKIGDQPNYEKAKKYFKASNTPQGHYHLGILYAKGHVGKNTPEPDYEQAKSCFEVSCKKGYSRGALALGILCMEGYVDKINNQPNYKLAVHHFIKATKLTEENFPSDTDTKDIAYHNLGMIYMQGDYGCKRGKPDYKQAELYFTQSKLPESFYQLGYLYEEGNMIGTPSENYKKAIDYYSKSTIPEAKLDMLWLYQTKKDELGLSDEEQEKKVDIAIKQINDLLPTLPLNEAFYIKGLSEYYINNWENALKCLQAALVLGSEEEEEISDIIQEIAYELEQEKTKEHKLVSKAEEDNNNVVPTVSANLPVHRAIGSTTKKEEGNEYETKQLSESELISSLKTEPLDKVTPIIREQKKQKTRKLKNIKLKVGGPADANLTFTQKPSSHIKFVFVSEKEEKEFTAAKESNTKLGELLKEIAQNGWMAKGVGKPEVLKYGFKGYKGCISRRINQEDRIVYKPLEQGKILILAWGGHYA